MSPKKLKTRYYQEEYLLFGYSYTLGADNLQLPLCLICKSVRKNSSMFPAKLKSHFLTSHRNEAINEDELKVKISILTNIHWFFKFLCILKAKHQSQMQKNLENGECDPLPRRIQKFSSFLSFAIAFLVAKSKF